MTPNRKRYLPSTLLAVVLALVLGVASCEGPAPVAPERTAQPEASPGFLGDLLGGVGDVVGGVVDATTRIVLGTDGEEYTLVASLLPGGTDHASVSRRIGDEGGSVSLAGHTLRVPPNAVERPTRFTMELAPNDFVEVHLSATRPAPGLLGRLFGHRRDVGTERDPFQVPVTLTLSYARSDDVEGHEDALLVLRMMGDDHDDLHEPLPSDVDRGSEAVRTQLRHFSGYCMAY